jgi:hypothetical protein
VSSSLVRASLLFFVCLGGLVGSLGWMNWQSEEFVLPYEGHCKDDVQYFAPGPDFPWADEEAPLDESGEPQGP